MSGLPGPGATMLSELGASFEAVGVDGESLGWANGTVVPSPLAAGPGGMVMAGVHALLLDAAMDMAVSAVAPEGTRVPTNVELAVEILHPVGVGSTYRLRGMVVHASWQGAQAEATMIDAEGRVMSRATATFLFLRDDGEPLG